MLKVTWGVRMQMQALVMMDEMMSLGSTGLERRHARRTNSITWNASFPTNPYPVKERLANRNNLHHQAPGLQHHVCNLEIDRFSARCPMACIFIKWCQVWVWEKDNYNILII